jgi:short subunit dehydrogenase-like uncharacterized protein
MSEAHEFDLILWGATGFTGKLVARHLVDTYGEDLNWAIAGRNSAKLEQLLDELGQPSLPILMADSDERHSLDRLAQRAVVICTTVGPYARHGTELVAACVAAGTHYCDLAGEVQWMARMIREHQAEAEATGARIVHTCGFDSIPTDLGTYYLQQQMKREYGHVADRIKSRVGKFSGAASGGTIASMMVMMEQARSDPAARKALTNPYSLYPAGIEPGPDGPDPRSADYDDDFQQWTCPFMMATINARVVRRSNALTGFSYGRNFHFDEKQLTGTGTAGRRRASRNAMAMSATMLTMAIGPARKLAARFLPAPGEGPTPEQQRKGHFELFLHGRHEASGDTLRVRVSGDRDPGYGATSRMLGEAAVCLARDDLDLGGGFWTPASAMGEQLIARLTASAGITFGIEEPL